MHPALLFAGQFGPDLAAWFLANSDRLGDAFARMTRPVMTALTDSSASIDRIGSVLVAQQNGQQEVLGLLHLHSAKLDGIGAAIDGLGAGQAALADSIGILSSLSMIGLGVAVLSQIHLMCQFNALTNRIKTIDARVRSIQDMLVQEHRAKLSRGLDDLGKAQGVATSDPAAASRYLFDARLSLAGSRASYAEQLLGHLTAPHSGETVYRWMLARHLVTATLGEATSHLRLNQPQQAVETIRAGAGVLRRHAAEVFARTIASKPTHFLMPALKQHGITLESLGELYRQAGLAGVPGDDGRRTAAELFESLREQMGRACDPVLWKERTVQRLRAEWTEASAAVEDVNRLQGVALAVQTYHSSKRPLEELAADILNQLKSERAEDGTCWAVFPNAPSADHS